MIRLIVKGIYALPVGNKTTWDWKIFDVSLPDVERYLVEKVGYAGCGYREIIGAEIVEEA